MFRKQFQFFQNLTSGFLNKQKAIDINTLDTGVRFLPMKKAKMPPNIEYKHTKPKNQAIDTSDIAKTSFTPGALEINPYNSIPNRFVLEKLAKSNGVSTNDLLLSDFSANNISDDIKKTVAKSTDSNTIGFDVQKNRDEFMNNVLLKAKTDNKYKINIIKNDKQIKHVVDNNAKSPYRYSEGTNTIIYNPCHRDFLKHDPKFSLAHEFAHAADIKTYRSFENKEFLDAIEKTRQKIYNSRDDYRKIRQMFTEHTGEYAEDVGISDIVSALTYGKMKVPVGHSKNYWKQDPDRAALEIFGNMSAIDITESKSKIEFFDGRLLSDLYEAYKKIIKRGNYNATRI